MNANPLLKLKDIGQSVWLDYIRRDLIADGKLRRLIAEDGLRGMTSNPSIFEKAITGSRNYDEDIRSMARMGMSTNAIYEALSQHDVQIAADEFRPVYDEEDARDGYVSLEVNPHLANDTNGTISEARRLWTALNRPNVFIKVPATAEGLPAIQQLISEGINVNVTLLFGLPRYRQVAEAYIAGLEARVAQGKSVKHIASVASFFVSRLDVLVDPLLEKHIESGGKQADHAKKAHGQVAIASATMAYQIYKDIFESDRFRKLTEPGARTQRLLWASTSTKNPDYDDLKYIEALIAPDTVNTVPLETLDTYREHGEPEARLEPTVEQAGQILQSLPELGIDIDRVTQQLEDEGIDKFNKAFENLLNALVQASSLPHARPDLGKITEHYSGILKELGADLESEGMKETPRRAAKALLEMTEGSRMGTDQLMTMFETECTTAVCHDMVIVEGIKEVGLCEHHLLPINMSITIAYIPDKKILGLSKLSRIAGYFARRLQNQERTAHLIATFIEQILEPLGVAVLMDGKHMCAMARGVRDTHSIMKVNVMHGKFLSDASLRNELMMRLSHGNGNGGL